VCENVPSSHTLRLPQPTVTSQFSQQLPPEKVDKELAWAMDTDLICNQITIDAIVVWDCDSQS
jgi:hypothetical protein